MTFLNEHTIHETADLIAAKQANIDQLQKARADFGRAFDAQWDDDFAALLKRWDNAKTFYNVEASAVRSTAPGIIGDDMLTTETAYQRLLNALRVDPGNPQDQPGDLVGLVGRAQKAKGAAINFVTPQPSAKDVDLEVYKKADVTLKTASKAGWIAGGVIGVLGIGWLLGRR